MISLAEFISSVKKYAYGSTTIEALYVRPAIKYTVLLSVDDINAVLVFEVLGKYVIFTNILFSFNIYYDTKPISEPL